MSCQHCVNSVTKAVQSVDKVESVQVNLEQGRADIYGGEPELVVKAIIEAGFNAYLEKAPIDENVSVKKDIKSQPTTSNTTISDQAYSINISDMTCSSCVANVQKTILEVPGVKNAAVNLLEKKALIEGGEIDQVIQAVNQQGYNAYVANKIINNQSYQFKFKQLSPEQHQTIKDLLQSETDSEITFLDHTVKINSQSHPADLLILLQTNGFEVEIVEQFIDPYTEQAQQAKQEIRLSWKKSLIAAGVGFGIMAGDMGGLFPELSNQRGQGFWGIIAIICLITMWFSGKSYYQTAIKKARNFSANMDTLIALGTAAAWLSSILVVINPNFIPGGGNHLYFDASVMILAFLQFGHALEISAKRTTTEAIGALVGLNPKIAHIIRNDKECLIPVSLIQLGDRIRVRPGEKVPIDGVIIEGSSSIDESMISGEHLAVKKSVDDSVIGGTLNQGGSFMLEVQAVGEDTTLAHIIEMVKQAQISKPRIGRLADQISAVFVPIVILISIITFTIWMLVGPQPQLAYSLTTAITVLVIACPCALGLATPIAIMVGTARAAQLNILIKNSDALQSASEISTLVVDKTGTLTEGKPTITKIYPVTDWKQEKIIQYISSLEFHSEHPLGQAVLAKAQQLKLSYLEVSNFNSLQGMGIEGKIAGDNFYAGNQKLLQSKQLSLPTKLTQIAKQHSEEGATPIWFCNENNVLALLILNDPIRADSYQAIQRLHNDGIKVIMCTGDNQQTANAVASQLKIETVYSEVLPVNKLEVVKNLQKQGEKVGMIGDGVNDAPALALADTSFAIGAGTDVAINNADITLTGNSLLPVSTAIELSRKTIKNIKQNLFGAFIYNSIGIPLAAGIFFPITGWLLQPMFASLAMALSSVTVVTNANRLRFFKVSPDVLNYSSIEERQEIVEQEKIMSESVMISIEGMSCNHCVGNAQKALQAVPGVETVDVSLENKLATITGNADKESLVAAVNAAGYQAS